jgi:hypothetical protein
MSGTAHVVIDPSLRPALEAVATIITTADLDVGTLHKIESALLPEGYNGVMNCVVRDGAVVRFERDMDT